MMMAERFVQIYINVQGGGKGDTGVLRISPPTHPQKSLDEKITPKNSHVEFPSLRWNNNSQHCCANHVACCCVLVAVVCKRCNNSQQHAATCNRVSKRTQHVTSCKTLGVVST